MSTVLRGTEVRGIELRFERPQYAGMTDAWREYTWIGLLVLSEKSE
jgi:hypothetical protein